jgi:SET domain-containing protein
MADGPPETLWVHPCVVVRDSVIEGRGLFATKELGADAIILVLGGRLVTTDELTRLIEDTNADPSHHYVDTLTIDENAHLVLPPGSLVHFGNHSCDPNLWHVGPYAIATRRVIQMGEELTVDYGTQSGAAEFSMACGCGADFCRGFVSSNDWRLPALQERYQSHWVPALEARITARQKYLRKPGSCL